jgi:hypothetical protein
MSFSKPREVNRNPAKKFLKWKGGDDQGHFVYWDKDKQKELKLDLGEFIVLDNDLFSITGYDEPNRASIISNEVRTIDDTLIVKSWKDKKSSVVLQGPYSQLKKTISESRVYKYTRSCYILLIETGELCHIGISGFGSYTISNPEGSGNYHNNVVVVKEIKNDKKGSVKFKYPVFAFGREITKDEADKAFETDSNVLQPYLEKYFAKGTTDTATHTEGGPDPANWREFEAGGKPLCEYDKAGIENIKQELVEINDIDSDLFMAVENALSEYKLAELNWRSKKDKSGKALEEYPLSEILDLLARTPPTHPAKITLEVAAAELSAEAGFADDEIPF